MALIGDGLGGEVPIRRSIWTPTFSDQGSRDGFLVWMAGLLDRWKEWGAHGLRAGSVSPHAAPSRSVRRDGRIQSPGGRRIDAAAVMFESDDPVAEDLTRVVLAGARSKIAVGLADEANRGASRSIRISRACRRFGARADLL